VPEVVYCTTSAAFLATPAARRQLVAIFVPVRAVLPTGLQQRTRVPLNATPPPPQFVPLGPRTGPLRYVVASRNGHRTLLAAWDRLLFLLRSQAAVSH
jgi:hypothetical protein